MAIVARSSRVSGTARTALRGAVEAVKIAASTRQSLFQETTIPCRRAEAVIQIPVEQVGLGDPRRPQLSSTPLEPTFSTVTSLT